MDKTTPMKAKPLVNVTCKLGAKGCFEDGRCHALGKCENKIETNADHIRNMSDEELAEFLDDLTDNCCRCAEHQNCGKCQIGLDAKTGFCDIEKWLQSEVKGSE